MTPQYSYLLPPSWKSQVSAWLDEDTPSFDYGGFVVGEAPREAFLLGKGSKRAVLAGTPFVDEIFRLLDCTYAPMNLLYLTNRRPTANVVVPCYSVEWHVTEGDEFEPIRHIATVRGKARYLLLGERVALNLLARCSGIATAYVQAGLFFLSLSTTHRTCDSSKRIKDVAQSHGFRGIIAGTRKTTPGISIFGGLVVFSDILTKFLSRLSTG
jgi:nicotinate-nucleotide pyrophosphorylase (carboxylating)